MIVIDRAKLKFLLAGREIEIDVTREYRKGRSYALGVSHKRSVCRVQVLERVDLEDGWRLTVKRACEEQPRLLSASPAGMRADYTSEPKKAARGEPEALTAGQLKLIRLRSGQEEVRRTAAAAHTLGEMSPSQRLAHLERVQQRVRVDIGDELRVISQRIERAERKLRRSAG